MDSPRKKILDDAAKCVLQDRNTTYGSPEKSFELIARLWSEVLGTDVAPYQVALCMVQLKVARLVANPTHHDSKVDGAGYFACMAEFDSPSFEPEEAKPVEPVALPPEYTPHENGGKHLFKLMGALPDGAVSVSDWVDDCVGTVGQIKLNFPDGTVEVLKIEKSGWRRITSPIKQVDYLIHYPKRYIVEDFAEGMTVEVTPSLWKFHKNPLPHFVRA